MSDNCVKLLSNLIKDIENINDLLVTNMSDPKMQYQYVCVKPNVTYEFYFQQLKKKWDGSINDFLNHPNHCTSILNNIKKIYSLIKIIREKKYDKILNSDLFKKDVNEILNHDFKDLIEDKENQELLLNLATNFLTKPVKVHHYELSENIVTSMHNLFEVLYDHCTCHIIELFKILIEKYKSKYQKKFIGKTQDEIIEIIKNDYNSVAQFFKAKEGNKSIKEVAADSVNKITNLRNFSIENELDELIPNDLGSLKQFFVLIISTYYKKIHPIIWVQIYMQIYKNIFIDLPYTTKEIYSFLSKYILLNSGPFILKILQMIRPILTPEMQEKYNLTKLTYPKLTNEQVNIILSKMVKNWDMYQVLANKSASVGHVSIAYNVDRPDKIIVLKMIKPISIAQSCWEYNTLSRIYKEGSCEQTFIKNILESNGREMNVLNEIENIKKGHQYYNVDYKEKFKVDIDAKLDTIEVLDGIVNENWISFAMSLAPGIPLSELIENNYLENDTRYRAKLHRCLDLLVYAFFFTLIKHGFYHGDLHSGNIYYSFEKSQLTLIDFGAVGELDVKDIHNETIEVLIKIVVMSIFYDYDGILDILTELMNSRCQETQIDMKSDKYIELKKLLFRYHMENIALSDIEKEKSRQYKNDIFSEERIEMENSEKMEKYPKKESFEYENIYSYLDYKQKSKETIVENRDILPVFTEILGNKETITFPKILEIIFKFYAESGVNISVKFNDLYEFQKAYVLLLGVLFKTHYNSYRTGIALNKAIINWSNIASLINIPRFKFLHGIYKSESDKFKYFKEKEEISTNYCTVKQHGGKDMQYKYMKYKTKYLMLKNII